MQRQIPRGLWIALVAMGIICFEQLAIGLIRGKPGVLIGVAANLVLLAGMYAGHRWAYVVTIAMAAVSVIILASRSPGMAIGTAIVDAFVVVPVILARSYFWTSAPPTMDSEHPC